MHRRVLQLPKCKLRRGFAIQAVKKENNYGKIMEDLRVTLEDLKTKNIIENKFADQMYKIVERSDLETSGAEEIRDLVNNGIWVHDQIVRSILSKAIEIFNRIGYSEDVLAEAFESIAKVHVTRGKNMSANHDLEGMDLFYDHRFDSLLEVFKYGLVKGNYMSSKTIARILTALTKLEYKSIDLQRLIQEKLLTSRYIKDSRVEDRFNLGDYTQEQLTSLPLASKKTFWSQTQMNQADIVLSERFQTYVDYIIRKDLSMSKSPNSLLNLTPAKQRQMHELYEKTSKLFKNIPIGNTVWNSLRSEIGLPEQKEEQAEKTNTITPDQPKKRLLLFNKSQAVAQGAQESENTQDLEDALDNLTQVLEKSKSSLALMADSIMKLRELYRQLGQLQREEFVFDNSSLMIDLMEVEELLLEIGVISLADVKKLDKDGNLAEEDKRMGQMLKQVLFELGASPQIIDDLPNLKVKKETKKSRVSLHEEGMYEGDFMDALEALMNYSYIQTKDFHPEKTYISPSFEQYVNPDHMTEKYIYKHESYPLAALRQLYDDTLVDRRKMTTAHPRFHNSAIEFKAFYDDVSTTIGYKSMYNGRMNPESSLKLYRIALRMYDRPTAAKALTFWQHSVKLNKVSFDKLMRYTLKSSTPVFFKLEKDDLQTPVMASLLKQVTNFSNLDTQEKIDLTYYTCLWTILNSEMYPFFTSFFQMLIDEFQLAEMCNNTNNPYIPLPENLRKMQLVGLFARAAMFTDIKDIEYMVNQVNFARRMNMGLEDKRDPIYLAVEDSIRNIFSTELSATTVVKLQNIISKELMPFGEIKNAFEYQLLVYLRKDSCYDELGKLSLETIAESRILETGFSKLTGGPVKILNVPYHWFVDREGRLADTDRAIEKLNKLYDRAFDGRVMPSDNNCAKQFLVNEAKQQPTDRTLHVTQVNLIKLVDTVNSLKLEESKVEVEIKLFDLIDRIKKITPLTGKISQDKSIYFADIYAETIRLLVELTEVLQQQSKEIIEGITKRMNVRNLRNIIDKIEEQAEEMKSYLKELGSIELPIFAGRRQGIEMINSNVSKEEKQIHPLEFFNYDLLSSPEYFNYGDWEVPMRHFYPVLDHLKDEKMKVISSTYGTKLIGINPASLLNMNFIRPANFSLNRDKDVHFSPEHYDPIVAIEKLIYLNEKRELPEGFNKSQIRYMTELENMKYSLKSIQDLSEPMSKIAKLSFIQDIVQKNLRRTKDNTVDVIVEPEKIGDEYAHAHTFSTIDNYLPRNATKYAEHLEALKSWRRRNHKYVQYVRKYSNQKEQVKKYHEILYREIPKMYNNLKKNNGDKQEFFKFRDYIKRRYKEVLRGHYDSVRDTRGAFSDYDIRQKIISFRINENTPDKTESRSKKSQDPRDKAQDKQLLKTRFEESQEKLVKIVLIFKLSKDIELSEAEKEYLYSWRDFVVGSATREIKPTCLRFPLGQLPQADKQILSELGFHIVTETESMCGSELTFELSEALNPKIILEFERSLLLHFQKKSLGFTSPLTSLTTSYYHNRKKQLLDSLEHYEWHKAQQFTEDDIKHFVELLSVDRSYNRQDRIRLTADIQSLKDFIESINAYEDRWDLLEKWLYRKSSEINSRQGQAIDALSKSDNELNKIMNGGSQKVIEHRIRATFKQDYESISSENLGKFCSGLVRRMYLLSHHFPPSLALIIQGVLNHPNLRDVDRLVDYALHRTLQDGEMLYSHPVLPAGPAIGELGREKQIFGNSIRLSEAFERAHVDIGALLTTKLDQFELL